MRSQRPRDADYSDEMASGSSHRDLASPQSHPPNDVQVTFTRDANGAVTSLVLHQFNRDRSR